MKGRYYGIFAIFIFCISCARAQKGCTDKLASNYSSQAKENDGSCQYNKTAYSPKKVCAKLNDTLDETSGLVYYANWFWTINDSGNPAMLYAFDSSSGKILHRTFIANQTNTDWEEITQDQDYFYIGDFGNNDGNRKDLHILKIGKAQMHPARSSDTVNAELINFSFGDQTSFNNTSQNHNFDMEAMCIYGDSIHLFSKDWADKKTRHYVLPKDTGTYITYPRESLNAMGQVTGACSDEGRGIITLTGYNTTDGSSFIVLLWNFHGHNVMSGNKRRIEIGNVLSTGQNEGICFKGQELYFSNEKRLTDQALWRIEPSAWVNKDNLSSIDPVEKESHLYVVQSGNTLHIRRKYNPNDSLYIYTIDGKLVYTLAPESIDTTIATDNWDNGFYIIRSGPDTEKIQVRK